MQTHLILIEGNPFTGKSTLSEFVALQLGLNGYPAQWVPEGVMLQQYFRHVLAVLENTQPISTESSWTDWNAFVEEVTASPSIFVVDSALSYAAVFPLMAANRPHEEIRAELRRIANVCGPLHPRVIHLTGDTARITHASIAERGEGWQEHMVGQSDAAPYQQARGRSGVDGAISFLQETQDLMRVILKDGGWRPHTLDVTATDWDTNRRAVLDFLGIAEVTVDRPVLLLEDLQAYTGTYVRDDPEGSGRTLSVRIEHDTLALHEPRMRIGPLVPVSATRFHIPATRLDAEFEVEDERAQRLVLLRSDGTAHVYRRVTGDTSVPERVGADQPATEFMP